MTVEEALISVEALLQQQCLNSVQELVFRQSWEGRTYLEIAEYSGYEADYIKYVGFQLWQLLSKALGKKVTKNNVHSVLRRKVQQPQVYVALPETMDPTTGAQQSVVSDQKSIQNPKSKIQNYMDWGEAIDVSVFYGRSKELATLEQWIVIDRCRLVSLLGIGGIGKSALAVKLAQKIQGKFDFLIWRSLRNAPSIREVLGMLIMFLSNQQETNLPETTDAQVSRLLEYLRASPSLLILDNAESILQSGCSSGCYQAGYEEYGHLLRCVAETCHQSCLVLTSREKPIGLNSKEGSLLPVRSLQLAGLEEAAAQELLKEEKLSGSMEEKAKLIQSYRGNPLALKIILTSIQVLFDGNIAEFLSQEIAVFNGIRRLLDQQFHRLTELEMQIMISLATHQEPVSVWDLQAAIASLVSKPKLLEALESLRRRSLLEISARGFSQQPMVMEYVREYITGAQQATLKALGAIEKVY